MQQRFPGRALEKAVKGMLPKGPLGYAMIKKLKVYAKWDVYRDTREWDSMKSLYCLTANYYFHKNFKLQANYSYTRDKSTSGDGRYNTFDLQMYWRF